MSDSTDTAHEQEQEQEPEPVNNRSTIANAYAVLLNWPKTLLVMNAALLAVAVAGATQFAFDASSETLVVEGDPDLAAYEQTVRTFGGDSFLLLTFTPNTGASLDPHNLDTLADLATQLTSIPGVATVFSILDAPLLSSPPVPISQLADGGFRTVRSPDTDRELAVKELSSSPLFRELLITRDGRTTAIRVDLAPDTELEAITAERQALQDEARTGSLTGEQHTRLDELDKTYLQARQAFLAQREQLISNVRSLRDSFSDRGTLHLGGVPMIAADMITFVKKDLMLFGGSVVVLILLALYAFFKEVRWVWMPVFTAAVTIVFTIGVLGAIGKPATVVSSNFISLLAIITISLIIHLIVRHRELERAEENYSDREIIVETMLSKFAPCLYTTITTMAAFGSLVAADIVPVEDFGYMMCLGLAISFFVTFTLFPALMAVLSGARKPPYPLQQLALTRALAHTARWQAPVVVALAGVVAVLAGVGISQVSLDNRFVEYFDRDTDIYEGMSFIDRELGGTIPFDVVLRFPPWLDPSTDLGGDDAFGNTDSFDDEFEDFDDESGFAESYPQRYWFSRDKLSRIESMHQFLEGRPEVGKVISLASLERLARPFNDGDPLGDLQIVGVLGAVPENLRAELISPYAAPASGEVRLSGRIRESGPAFDRGELVRDIRRYATEDLGFQDAEVTVTGMMVLFQSMLNQLFTSQVDTLAYVLGAAFLMFLVLLRSLLFSVLGLIPNILAAATVIAFMGFVGHPLDMMTITIAAISIGIGVDDAIHYLHRFQEELKRWGDVRIAVAWSHASVGRAMYFTSLTIIIGFSVLAFSNFVPTVMFGLLTAVAMALALLTNLTLLPALLVMFVKNPVHALPAKPAATN